MQLNKKVDGTFKAWQTFLRYGNGKKLKKYLKNYKSKHLIWSKSIVLLSVGARNESGIDAVKGDSLPICHKWAITLLSKFYYYITS